MIAKTMFRDGHLSGKFEGIRPALFLHLGIESCEECFGKFGKIRVCTLDGAPPKNKIGD